MKSSPDIGTTRNATLALLGLFLAGFLCISGIAWFFQRLISDIDRQLANERVHLFIGEQILLNAQHSELIVYKLAPAANAEMYKQLLKRLDATADQINEYMQVMRVGGNVRDSVVMEGMTDAPPGRPMAYTASHSPKMREMEGKFEEMTAFLKNAARELITRLEERDRCFTNKLPCVTEATNEVRAYFRQLPPFFKQLNHHADRHRQGIVGNLARLEDELRQRQADYRRTQLGLILLVAISMLGFAVFFTRRINAAQAQLLEARRAAEAGSLAKSHFLATVSHEIRTPMNGVLGMIHLLLDTRLDAEQRSLVRDAAASGESLLQIINDILDLSKIEAGRMEFELRPLQVRALAESILGANRVRAQQKKLELVVDVSPEAQGCFTGDEQRIRQVLLNLVGNAVKFTERGEVRVRISRTRRGLRFEVSDTGIGIPEAARAKLFTSFSQVDSSTSRRFGGTGLGLAISRQLVEGMGGHIDVSSKASEGSCFWFELPLAPCEAPSKESLQAPSPAVAPPAPADPPPQPSSDDSARVLLAEDNVINQRLAETLLARLGYQVDMAANGAEALAAVQRRRYALVLMDVQMPVMDGLEATRQIRKLRGEAATVPIIAVTANAMQSDREACIAAGMNDFIAKPFSRATLADFLARWAPLRTR